MKNKFLILFLLFIKTIVLAQSKDAPISFTYAEFRGGYGINIFSTGLKEKYNQGNFIASYLGLKPQSLSRIRKRLFLKSYLLTH